MEKRVSNFCTILVCIYTKWCFRRLPNYEYFYSVNYFNELKFCDNSKRKGGIKLEGEGEEGKSEDTYSKQLEQKIKEVRLYKILFTYSHANL